MRYRSDFWPVALATLVTMSALPAQAIVGGIATTNFKHVGDGVQITEYWVLTARHLANAVGSSYTNGFGSSTIEARVDFGSGAFPADDLSLLRLSTPIAAPALSLLDHVYGAGTDAPFAATITTNTTQVPRGYALADISAVWTQVDPDGDGPRPEVAVNWLVAYNSSFSAPYVQGGDSGGGLFLGHVTDSVSPLIGISSALLQGGSVGNPAYGSAFVQIAAYKDWIDSTLAGYPGVSQEVRWVSNVPEPATTALFAAGFAALYATTRRRRIAAAESRADAGRDR